MPKAWSAVALTTAAALFIQSPSVAGTYDALCAGVECKISLDGKGVSGPAGFIPAHRIAQWYTGGGEENNTAAQVAGTTGGVMAGAVAGALAGCWLIVTCPIGIIGGAVAGGMGGSKAGKSADFYFTVIGYNQNGDKVTQSFNFLNKKPAGRMMQELPAVSGLGMGEMRSVEQIKEGDARAAATGTGRPQLPANIGSVNSSTPRNSSLPMSLNDSPGAQAAANTKSNNCWSAYKEKPGINTWIKSNPAAAVKLKAKYAEC
jgi:hypothetical protein